MNDRLKWLYASLHTSLEMKWHTKEQVAEEGVLRHPTNGKAWKNLDKTYSDFAVEPKNV